MTIKIHILKLFSILSVLAMVFSNIQIAHAAGLVVFNTNDSGAGSLRQVIADAASGDTITFAPALSGQIITLASQLNIDKNLTIDGSTLVARITISGNHSVRVFQVNSGWSVTLDGFDIVDGTASSGAGINNLGSMLTVRDMNFTGNIAGDGINSDAYGGAIYNEAGTLNVNDSSFHSNQSHGQNGGGGGGGIYNASGTVLVTNSSFLNNSSSNGGGISNMQGTVVVENCVFSNNHGIQWGGAIFSAGAFLYGYSSSLTIEDSVFSANNTSGTSFGFGGGGAVAGLSMLNILNSTFSGNSAQNHGGAINYYGSSGDVMNANGNTFSNNYAALEGGGLYMTSRSNLKNNTFFGNTAARGGGIYGEFGYLTLENDTLSNNTASQNGGALYMLSADLYMKNTILANSISPTDCYGATVYENIHNLIETNALSPYNCDVPFLTGDPKLGALANNGGSTQTMSLLPGSPAIDAGDDASCPATDQRGTPRPQGSHCDLGAYEVDNATMLIMINSHPSNPTNSSAAAFTFSVSDNGGPGIASVECQLDGGGFSGCTSPRNYDNLGVGSHTFQVKATDTLGYSRVTAFSWVIDTSAPDTTITAYPSDPDSDFTPNFSFSGKDVSGIASFMCKMDGGAFNLCTSPFTSSTLLPGPHTFSVYAIDNASNADPSPASYSWTVVPAPVMVLSVLRAGGNPSSTSSVAFTVKFSVEVTGVDSSDFQLTTTGVSGASIKSVTGSGNTYTVIVGTGLRSGSIRLDIPSSTNIVDGLGTPLANLPYTGGEAYSIVKTPAFSDVPFSYPYYDDIEILFANGLTGGCSTSPLKFCPDQTMNRGQAAVFNLRANFGSSYVPPTPTHRFKDDWKKGPWAETWAEGMYYEGLSAGCSSNPLKYCPWDQIPREQAVIFALRMKYGTAYTPPAATGTLFADMTNKSYFATSWAEQAYKDGLIPNCGTTGGKPMFCPKALVSRGLAASMIVRAKNLTMP